MCQRVPRPKPAVIGVLTGCLLAGMGCAADMAAMDEMPPPRASMAPAQSSLEPEPANPALQRTFNPLQPPQPAGAPVQPNSPCGSEFVTERTLDEDSALGFRMEDVLTFAEGPRRVPLRFHAPASHALVEDSLRPNTLLVTVTPVSDAVREIGFEVPEAGGNCRGRLETRVTVSLSDQHGLLAGAFEASLIAPSAEYAYVEHHEAPPQPWFDALGLSEVQAFDGTTLAPLRAAISLAFAPDALSGSLRVAFLLTAGPELAAGFEVAEWGTVRCPTGIGVNLDHVVQGLAVGSLVTAVEGPFDATLTWADGQVEPVRIAWVSDGDGACVSPEGQGTDTKELALPGRLSIRTADSDRVDGNWPGVLRVPLPNEGAEVQLEMRAGLAAANVQAMVDGAGFSGLDMQRFNSAALAAELHLPTTDDGGLQGAFAISAASDGSYCGYMGAGSQSRWLEPHPALTPVDPTQEGGCHRVVFARVSR